MHFTGEVWRPPYEAGSMLVQLTSGCMYHRCRFCGLYRTAFRLSPLDEFSQDLDEVAQALGTPGPRRVFLTGANPLGIANSRLVPALKLVHGKLPGVQTIGGFIRIDDVKRKDDDELAQLASLGVEGVTIGVESGHDPALAFMEKGHTGADIVEQCHRLDQAGIRYNFFHLLGLSGTGAWKEAAQASAAVYSQTHPLRITLLSMTLYPNSLLAGDIEEGRFTPATELELLHETRALVDQLTCATIVSTAHVSDAAPFEGMLPRDRTDILTYLDAFIADADEATLKHRRERIWTL